VRVRVCVRTCACVYYVPPVPGRRRTHHESSDDDPTGPLLRRKTFCPRQRQRDGNAIGDRSSRRRSRVLVSSTNPFASPDQFILQRHRYRAVSKSFAPMSRYIKVKVWLTATRKVAPTHTNHRILCENCTDIEYTRV